MKIFKKNQIVIVVIALMLITAGYLNYTSNNIDTIETIAQDGNKIASIGDATLVSSTNVEYTNNTSSIISDETIESSVDVIDEENNYFTDSKMQRDKMYSQMIESYQKIIENQSVSEEQKTISTNQIAEINKIKNAIMITENLVITKGFDDVVIFVNDQSISVIVSSKENLSTEQIAQIQNIVSRELNSSIENIHISVK